VFLAAFLAEELLGYLDKQRRPEDVVVGEAREYGLLCV